MEVNNFSLALPGLVDYLVIRLNRLKVPKWYLIQRASVSWLELVWLIIQSEQGWTGLTLGKSGISVTCVNKFNLNENILTLHSAQAQGLASVVTMNSKTAPSDRARRSRDDWADWRSDSLQWTSGVSQSLLRAGRGRMWTLHHSITPTRYQDVSVPRPGGLTTQCYSRHPGGCGGGENLSHQQILLRHF